MQQVEVIWPRDALPRGTDVNGYCIEDVIGRGGFGITYRATDGIDQVFAVKECFPKQFAVRQGSQVLPSDHTSVEPFNECLSRFGGEARALRQLAAIGAAGEGVVKVATFFQANGTAYVVMEFLDGESLDSVIKAQPAGIAAAQLDFILPRLLHAVGCVHTAGLLHRDIKPANIILREDNRPVLIDFGAARTSGHGRTVTFTQVFSEGYAPIEQFAGTRQGSFSDIYAVGATLYRAIGGSAVDSFTRHQALLRGRRDPQPAATVVGAGRYAPRLLSAIDAAMVVAPEDRPQSVAELLALLDEAADPDATRVAPRAAAPAQADATVVRPVAEMPAVAEPQVASQPQSQAAVPIRQPRPRAPLALGLVAVVAGCSVAGYLVYFKQPAKSGRPAQTATQERMREQEAAAARQQQQVERSSYRIDLGEQEAAAARQQQQEALRQQQLQQQQDAFRQPQIQQQLQQQLQQQQEAYRQQQLQQQQSKQPPPPETAATNSPPAPRATRHHRRTVVVKSAPAPASSEHPTQPDMSLEALKRELDRAKAAKRELDRAKAAN